MSAVLFTTTSSIRAPHSFNRTDLPHSPCPDVSFCLPAKISRVPSSAHPITRNKFGLRCRHVWCPGFFDFFTAVAFTDFCHFGFALRFGRLLVPTNQQLRVRTFRSFDAHPRIASVLLSFPSNFCLNGFLFLSCRPSSCPCRIFLCLSLSGSWRRLPLNLRRVCFWPSRLEDTSAPQVILSRHA